MEIPRYWRNRGQRLRLEGTNCPACEVVHFPPRRICPDCGHDNQKPLQQKNIEAQPQINIRQTNSAEII